MATQYRHACPTGAGWCCLWDAAAFRHVTDEDSHHDALIDDAGLEQALAAAALVPINDFRDGGYDIGVRVADRPDEAPLSGEERASAMATSRPYRFSTAGLVCVSGMEYVGHPIDQVVAQHAVTPGVYVARVYRFGPEHMELPEFLVALQPSTAQQDNIEFCTDSDTFNQQPTLPTGHVGFRVHTCSDWRQLKKRIMTITGHDTIGVSVPLKSREPVYLGNGHQNPERIACLVQPLIDAVTSLNGTFEFLVDDQHVEPLTLLTMFRRDMETEGWEAASAEPRT